MVLVLLGQANQQAVGQQKARVEQVDNFMERIRKRYGVPGIALAIVKGDKVIHQNCYGFANLEQQVPVSEKTIFRLYSLTKPLVVTEFFHLVEKRKVRLDDPISRYVDGLPEQWRQIELKYLLAHASGLPDIAGKNPDEVKDLTETQALAKITKQPMRFKKGARYDYNQTNFWLLQKVMEKVRESSLKDFLIKRQLSGSKACFSSDSRDIVRHRANAYFPFSKGKLTISTPYVTGDYIHAANGLNLSLNDFVTWDRNFRKNELLSAEAKKQMWQKFSYSVTKKAFTHGWDVYQAGDMKGFGFSGTNSTIYVTFPDQDVSVIYLSNGFSRFYNIRTMVYEIVRMAKVQ